MVSERQPSKRHQAKVFILSVALAKSDVASADNLRLPGELPNAANVHHGIAQSNSSFVDVSNMI